MYEGTGVGKVLGVSGQVLLPRMLWLFTASDCVQIFSAVLRWTPMFGFRV